MNRQAAAHGPREHALREPDRHARPGPPLLGARPGARSPRALIRDFPDQYPLFAQKDVRVQQHHAVQPQPPAVDRSHGRRGEDRVHRSRRLLPRRLGARAASAASSRWCSARKSDALRTTESPEAAQLRLPGLRDAAASTARARPVATPEIYKGTRSTVHAGLRSRRLGHAAARALRAACRRCSRRASPSWRRLPRARKRG